MKLCVKSNKPWFRIYAEKDGWCYGLRLKKRGKELSVRIRSDLVVESLASDWKRIAIKNVPDILLI